MKETISAKITSEDKKKLEEIAGRERRTLSQLISIIIEDWLKSNSNCSDPNTR